MGIEVQLYRIRIGSFCGGRAYKSKNNHGNYEYNRFSNSSDIHYRAFCCCILIIYLLVVYLALLRITDAAMHMVVDSTTLPPCHVVNDDVPVFGPRTISNNVCPNSEHLYLSYVQRLLLLASDVELNPGPRSDTQLILDAIHESNEKIELVRNDVTALRLDIGEVKKQISDISSRVGSIEKRQKEHGVKIQHLEGNVDNISYRQEVVETDFREIAYHYEKSAEEFDALRSQVNYIEKESIKNNLRIFGIQEDQNETDSSLKELIEKEIVSEAFPDKDNNPDIIEKVKRIGITLSSQPRMVLVKFKSMENKIKLFGVRDVLRSKGIRISNDLTSQERSALKELKRKGKRGYFKNGSLQIVDNRERNVEHNTRVIKRAARQSVPAELANEAMESENIE